MTIIKEYYRLNEASEILGCKIDDLIHYAANDRLLISVIPNERIGKKSNSAITLIPTDRQTWVTIERDEKDLFINNDTLSLLENGAPEIIEDFGRITGVKVIRGIPIVSQGEYLKGQLPLERYVITRIELEKLQKYIQPDIDIAKNSTFKPEAVADGSAKAQNKTKPPLDREQQKSQDSEFIELGYPEMPLRRFIDTLLTKELGRNGAFKAFYSLVEDYGLEIYDKPIDGNIVDSKKLLETLRNRGIEYGEEQRKKLNEDWNYDFWTLLIDEKSYSIERDDVEKAYRNAGKKYYPWFKWGGEELTHIPINEALPNDSAPDQKTEALANAGAGSQVKTMIKKRELKTWLWETWLKEDRPGGVLFFKLLKKYVNQPGSPITQHYTAGRNAGIDWKTSSGTTGELKKKSIQTIVSTFKLTS